MRTKRDRDGALDQLLRQQAQTAAEGDAAGPCLDAETLSAWPGSKYTPAKPRTTVGASAWRNG